MMPYLLLGRGRNTPAGKVKTMAWTITEKIDEHRSRIYSYPTKANLELNLSYRKNVTIARVNKFDYVVIAGTMEVA